MTENSRKSAGHFRRRMNLALLMFSLSHLLWNQQLPKLKNPSNGHQDPGLPATNIAGDLNRTW
jgi:hypothetical protein